MTFFKKVELTSKMVTSEIH